MRHGSSILILLLVLGCRSERPAAPALLPAPALEQVSRVLDGDTVEVAGERIRLKGINAPESGECGADEATALLEDLVSGGVRVDRRGSGDHGRTLAYLYGGDGTGAHTALAAAGRVLAYPYGDYDDQADGIAAQERAARQAHRGLFDPAACGPPAVAAGVVRIAEVVNNPAGDDLAVGAGEYVAIAGPPGTDLSGWTLKDTSAGNRFTFPAGTRLPDGGLLRVHTPCGDSTPEALFWCRKGAGVWNNTGDVAFLLDPAGNLVSDLATPR